LKSLFVRLLIGALACFMLTPATAFAACSTPTANAGEMLYNADYGTMQFCNGTTWVSMAAGSGGTEVDPKVGTLVANAWCKVNSGGTALDCSAATIPLTALTTTGTADSSTFLRGDGEWVTPSFSLPALTDANIWVGNGSNAATAVVMSGDATLSNTGALAIGAGKITNTMLAGSITISKLSTSGTPDNTTYLRGDGAWATVAGGLPTLTDGYMWLGNGSNAATAVIMSGDATITNTGVLAIGASKITNTMLAGSITVSKLSATGTADDTTYLRGDGVWATVSGGSATPAGSVAGAIQFRGATAVLAADDVNFIWDDTNNRIGVGTATPTESIDTTGNVKSVLHKFNPQTGWASPGSASGSGIGTLSPNAFCTANGAGTQVVCTTSTISAATQLTGTLAATHFPALTGDVTTTAGSLATTIGASKVTNAMLAGSIALSKLDTTGTADNTTYLRGDGVWTTVSAGGSGTVNSGTAGYMAYYASTGTDISGNANARISSGVLTLGTAGSVIGKLAVTGNTSGTVTIQPQAAAGTYNFNLPTTAGTSGYVLTSGGGAAAAQTWTSLATVATSGSASNLSAGTLAVARGGTGTGTAFTTGSVVFAGASGVYSQDNSGLFWDDSLNSLGIGTSSPTGKLQLNDSNNNQISLQITNMSSGSTVNDGLHIRLNSSDVDFLNREAGDFIFWSNSISVGTLTSAGNLVLNGNSYVNFNTTSGSTGYGFRDSGGTMQYKNSGGSWTAFSSGITADSLNFTDFSDSMTLDAATTIAGATTSGLTLTQSGSVAALTITNTGSGNSLVVNDASSDTTPFVIDASGNVGIGTTTPGALLDVAGDIRYTGVITDISDLRLKKDVAPLGASLAKITALQPITFRMKDDKEGRGVEYGFAAQEVQKIYPDLIKTADDKDKTLSLNYMGLIAPMVEAIKELKADNDNLRARLQAMETLLNAKK
jgi:hypothetical protein